MENKKVLMVIGSIPYIIDTKKRELRHFTRPEKIIPFAALKDEGSYFTYQYHTKENPRPFRAGADITGRTIDLIIPNPLINDHNILGSSYIYDMNSMSQKQGWGFYIADEALAMRLSGKLPHIDLAGTDFTIDWRLRELRETELPWNRLGFERMEESESGEEYLLFYDTVRHEIYEPDENLLRTPENIVVLEIPYELKLDPVAVAREYGLDDTDLLTEHPFTIISTAKVTPIAESGLPEYIENNLRRHNGAKSNDQTTAKKGR